MRFKMITLSEKDVGRIAGNAGTHADLMTRDLTARWRSKLPEGQEVIDIHQLQLCVRDDLRDMRREMVEIESRHLTELENDRLTRELRDGAVPELRERLMGIQRLMDGTYGAGTSAKIFGEETVSIPIDPFPLRRVGHFAHKRLMDPRLVLPKPRLGGISISPPALAKTFEAPLATLDEVLVGLEDTLPASHASYELKVRQLEKLRQQIGIAARFLEALYRLAGHDVIAERVRVSSHRPRRPDGEGEGGEGAGGEAGLGTGGPVADGGEAANDGFPFEAAANDEAQPASRATG